MLSHDSHELQLLLVLIELLELLDEDELDDDVLLGDDGLLELSDDSELLDRLDAELVLIELAESQSVTSYSTRHPLLYPRT